MSSQKEKEMPTPDKKALNREQLLQVMSKFMEEFVKEEFGKRFMEHVKQRGPQTPNQLFDELEVLQKFLYLEWDLFPDVGPEEMLDTLHQAGKDYRSDEKFLESLTNYCMMVERMIQHVAMQTMPEEMKKQMMAHQGGGAHGHSHGGVPCHGHGGHSHGPHGHSHGPHGHGGGGGGQPQMSPQQMQLMQMAVETALTEEERKYMGESQMMLMQGKMSEITEERKKKMMEIQNKILAYVETMSSFLNPGAAGGGVGGDASSATSTSSAATSAAGDNKNVLNEAD